jgi:hypothetical protein
MRNRFTAACFLFFALFALATAHAAVLTSADAPLRLIRGSTVYKAANGVALQKDDILESGASGAQVEAGPDTILALGPQTRVLLDNLPLDGRGAMQAVLLQGWLKVMDKNGHATVVTPALQLSFANGSAIVHAAEGQDAVFAEEGDQQLTRLDTRDVKAKGPLKLAFEQYAALEPGKPVAPGRPPRAFVAAMPPSFRDRLARAPDVPRAGKVQPIKERETEFADVQDWLQASLPARKAFVARFKPRLADPVFRKALDGALGQSVDWKPVLHPVKPRINQEKSS